jgi:uncharacterized protein YkwD
MFKPHGARMALRVPIALAGIGLASAGSALGAVNPDDPQSVRDAFAATILANNTISPAWTGSVTGCHPGTESPTSAAATIANVNYFRTMNRLAPVGLAGAAINAKAQAAALMFEANNDLSHSPGSNWACATAGGIEAAGRSNIALGIAGAQTVSAYVEDAGDYNDAAGHRRWILYPRARTFGTGSTTRANALWVIESTDGSRPSTDIVAWPSKGYVPWPLVYERWTVSSNLAPDADYTAARVTVSTGGALLAVSKQTVHDGYADNTLVFDVTIPDALRSAGAETAFDVTVTNVLVNGTARTLRYRTTAIPADTTDAPTAVTTTVTADAATIDWRSPAEPTSPVTGYRVTVVDGRGTPVFSQDVAADGAGPGGGVLPCRRAHTDRRWSERPRIADVRRRQPASTKHEPRGRSRRARPHRAHRRTHPNRPPVASHQHTSHRDGAAPEPIGTVARRSPASQPLVAGRRRRNAHREIPSGPVPVDRQNSRHEQPCRRVGGGALPGQLAPVGSPRFA